MKESICSICGIEKRNTNISPRNRRCNNCIDLHRCSHCKKIKHKSEFWKDVSRSSGLSSKCKICDIEMRRTRKITQYSYKDISYTPTMKARQFFKDTMKRLKRSRGTRIWKRLGFSKEQFQTKFPEIPKGYNIDHCVPLSWFVDETPINISCALDNLQLLESKINISKSNRYADPVYSKEYFLKIFTYIRPDLLKKLYLAGGLGGYR